MASRPCLPEEELTCPVCMDIFTDPVVIKCSHSFCKDCLQKCWQETKAGECPICRKTTTEDPTCNLVLKNLCQTLRNRTDRPASCVTDCSVHGERLKLFCLKDEEPICAICQTSKKHEKHQLRPVEEAVSEYKEEIDIALRPLQEKLEALNEEKQKSDHVAQLVKSQAECTAIEIQKEFEILHQFLRDEQAARIAALREEEEHKSQRMKERAEKLTKEISSLTDTIRALEQEMKADDISFLQNYKTTKIRAKYKVPDPDKLSGECINVAKHLGNLKYRVWEKMQEIVQYTPVTLDPNMKGDDVTVSEDLTSLRCSGEPSCDDDLSKFCALGSKGFLSGKYCWDVEVGENPAWVLGVAENSSSGGEPERAGMWAVGHKGGEYKTFTLSGKDVKLNVRREVKKVRVQLDWDRGTVSFSDPTNNTSLHTFECKFTGRLFPWFFVSSNAEPLRICPLKISVTVG